MFHNILKKSEERAIQASCFSVFNENLNMCVLPLGKQVNPSQLLAQQTLLILVLILKPCLRVLVIRLMLTHGDMSSEYE